jgi:hypothetical protein
LKFINFQNTRSRTRDNIAPKIGWVRVYFNR